MMRRLPRFIAFAKSKIMVPLSARDLIAAGDDILNGHVDDGGLSERLKAIVWQSGRSLLDCWREDVRREVSLIVERKDWALQRRACLRTYFDHATWIALGLAAAGVSDVDAWRQYFAKTPEMSAWTDERLRFALRCKYLTSTMSGVLFLTIAERVFALGEIEGLQLEIFRETCFETIRMELKVRQIVFREIDAEASTNARDMAHFFDNQFQPIIAEMHEAANAASQAMLDGRFDFARYKLRMDEIAARRQVLASQLIDANICVF